MYPENVNRSVKLESISNGPNKARILLYVLSAFCLFSFGYSCIRKEPINMLVCVGALILIWLPWLIERLLGIKLSNTLKSILMIFAVAGSIVGHVYAFFYSLPFSDKLLHTLNGFLFAGIGFALPGILNKRPDRRDSILLRLFMAFCLSMTVAVIWECFEYGMDTLFLTDMQQDHIVPHIISYKLGSEGGSPLVINDIRNTAVNSMDLGIGGYLDLGIHDTMQDLLSHMAGALIFSVTAFFRTRSEKSRFLEIFVLSSVRNEKTPPN